MFSFKSSVLRVLLFLFVAAQQAAAQTASATQTPDPNSMYNGGDNDPQDPNDAGAEGSDKGAFNLSKGGLGAIIAVVVLVAVLGIGSAVLFWLAKKRQWDVRRSIRRASRRLTGRSDVSRRQNRRTGVRLNSPPPSKSTRQDKDVEKALPAASEQGKTTTTITSTFDVDTPTPKAKSWKPAALGGKK